MFTSRSEFRLLLRIDNADRRLRPLGYKLGLISETEYTNFREKCDELERLQRFLKEHRWNPNEASCPLLGAKLDVDAIKGISLQDLLRRPEIVLADFEPLLQTNNIRIQAESKHCAEIEVKYEGYIQQQARDAEKLKKMSARRIPKDLDYSKVDGLNREMREKLSRVRPLDLAMASRIPGVTSAAVSIINVQLELLQSRRKASQKE
jgi:tRNA uridine 5-carboxymethylaminomethyl modification enzyme